MKLLFAGFALGASVFAYSAAAQEAQEADQSRGDAEAETSAEAPATPPPAPIVIVPAPAPDKSKSPRPLLVPPPAPPPSARSAAGVPPTNVRGPYPRNQRPVTDFLDREEDLEWRQAPAVLLPGLIESGRKQLVEGETLFEVPLLWSQSAYIDGDVTISGVGEPVVLERGSVLPLTALVTSSGVDERYSLFCTIDQVRRTDRDLFSSIIDSFRDAQWCLQDSDGDGTLDLAVVLSAGAPVRKADDIEPIPYEMRYGQPIPGSDSFVRFTLDRVGRDTVTLAMQISQAGEGMVFDTLTTGRYQVSKYTSFDYEQGRIIRGSVLGINFGIRAARRRDNLAEIEWSTGSRARREILPIPWKVTVNTTYTFY